MLFYHAGTCFLKVPKSFWVGKAIRKILNLKFTDLSFSHNFNMNKGNVYAKLNAHTLLSFRDIDY